jgi:Putative transmembrane protein (PGPGW)
MTAWRTTIKPIKRIVVAVVGGTVLALGVVLIVLPGPAFVVIPAGLAILAFEFAWARRWLRSARAILPRRSKNDSAPPKKLTGQSVRRSGSFLLRQAHRTLVPKRNL